MASLRRLAFLFALVRNTAHDTGEHRSVNGLFNCGHPRAAGNIMYEYGYQRCRECRRAANRRHMRKKRAQFVAEHGRYNAVPSDD